MIKIVAVHTAIALVEQISKLFKEHLPDVKLNHIVDDSLIQEVISNNQVTPAVSKRLFNYYFAAVDAGANLIFNICSSVGEVAETARSFISIPQLKIDDPMAINAVQKGTVIGVLATLPTTLRPTVNLLKNKAKEEKNSQYVKRLGFRFLEALRNHVQHRGFPIHQIYYSYQNVGTPDNLKLLHTVVPNTKLSVLEEDKKFKKEILNEMKANQDNDAIDIRPLIREYVEGIGKVHGRIRERR